MPVEVSTIALELRVPESIEFADMGIAFNVATRRISFNEEVMARILKASGMAERGELPSELANAIICMWYRQARAQGQPEDPHMERYLFDMDGMADEPAAHTVH